MKEIKMKKRFLIAAGMLVALGVQAAVIIDPGFERAYDSAGGTNRLTLAVNSQLYPSGAISTTPIVQDGYGWLAGSGMRGNSNLDAVNNYWILLGAAPNITPFTTSIGQINTDNKETKGLQQFEFTVSNWSVNNQAQDRVKFYVEVYGYTGTGTHPIGLASTATPNTIGWTLIGAASTADIAGTGVYTTGSIDFGTGWDKVAFRISPVDVNQTFGNPDTLSISRIDVIPEPMMVGML